MQLRQKTIIIIGLTLVAMILLIAAASLAIRTASYNDIENREISSRIDIALNQINYYISTLDRVAVDYAYWDDTYSYAVNGGPDSYIESNFVDTTMLNQKLNAVVIVNASGQIIYARGYDLERGVDAPVPAGIAESLGEGSPLIRQAATGGASGIVMLPGGPMTISAYPILRSDGEGASAGTLIMGRYLSDSEVAGIRNMSGIAIAVCPYRDTGMPAGFEPSEGMAAGDSDVVIARVSDDIIRGYTLIPDLYGNPALVLSVEEPRVVYQQSKSVMLYIVVSLLISGLIFGIVVIFFLERMVISRMIRLSKSVGRIGLDGDISARVPVDGDDEVAGLARTINQTLDALEASRQRLQDNEERLRDMVENISDVVWETDAAMRLTYVSPKAREVFGYEPDALLGRSPFDLVRPGEKEPIRKAIHDMNVRTGSFSGIEFWITRPDGTPACIEVGGNSICGPAGEIAGYRGIARDVTGRRQAEETLRVSEERLRLCAATARFGTFDWDIPRNSHLWSPETYEIYGIPPGTTLTSDRVTGMIYPGDRQDDTLAAAMDPAGPGEYTMEYRIIRASDGAVRWVYVRARVFFEGEGNGRRAVRVLGAIQDITGRKQTEEAMAASLGEKDVLLKEIHHRVKNNLQIISSLLSLQSGSIKGQSTAIMFRESQDRIRSMALIHEKLYQSSDLSRIDFAEYVRSLTSYLSHSYASGRKVAVAVDIEAVSLGIDTAIPCGLIINELVSNALKYAFPGDRSGEVRIGLVKDGAGYVLTVGDNGAGFPPGLDFRHTPSLGLQLVNTLVGQLEGTIELDTAGGTTFRIAFRVRPGPVQNAVS